MIITNIEDLRRIARRKIPRAIYDYVERGSYDELTLNANRNDLDAIRLRQRVLIDVSKVSLTSTMLFDGGIRSGQDVLEALGRGARGCLIGRAYLYGLAAGGEAGVRQALEIIRAELEVAMTLTGTRDVRSVTGEVLGSLRQ
jgi:isopentenyl diphosphate isomerase/L-lactate dehydrogenase-like FMN-dependent dehydrogenase